MLKEKYSQDSYLELLDVTSWTYLPSYTNDDFWCGQALKNQDYVEKITEYADDAANESWPHLTQELYDEFQLNGNRSNYEGPYFRCRNYLSAWCVAEYLQRKGLYVQLIAEALRSIIEEPTWCLPAHNGAPRQGKDAVDAAMCAHNVDLFAAESAMLLSSVWACIGSQLSQNNVDLAATLKSAVEERVLIPVESGVDYGWLQGGNNWGPWCASNCLMAAAQLWPDRERFARYAYYLSDCIDKFIDNYHDDGACDEGPDYWGKAAGSMFIFLECLYRCSDGRITIFDKEKINRMMSFIQDTHISGDWFVNFADGNAAVTPAYGLISQCAQRCQSPDLFAFAQDMYELKRKRNVGIHKGLTTASVFESTVQELYWFDHCKDSQSRTLPRCMYMADTEIFMARESEQSDKGFVLAAKGGHNQENHNHNDIGQFILFYDAQPVIIDVGVGTYTRETFREDTRYKIWPIGAQSHNPPIINRTMQQVGAFRARTAGVVDDPDASTFALSLLDAYEEHAGCSVIDRSCTLLRGEKPQVIIQDSCRSQENFTEYEIRLVSPFALTLTEDCISFSHVPVCLHFNADVFSCVIEERPLDDPKLAKHWGDCLWVMIFSLRSPASELESVLRFSKIEHKKSS